MKPIATGNGTTPTTNDTPDGRLDFAPRETHVDFTQREQEKANSQQLQEDGPQGGGPDTPPPNDKNSAPDGEVDRQAK